jgi:hypothetical protein
VTCPALEIQFRDAADGRLLLREPVRPQDLAEPLAEVHREGFLRHGTMRAYADPASADLLPVLESPDSSRCLGYALRFQVPDGPDRTSAFSSLSLGHVARRGQAKLPAETEPWVCELHVGAPESPGAPPTSADPLGAATVTRPPWHYLEVPLAPLRRLARTPEPYPTLPAEADPFPVFYTGTAYLHAEEFARRGTVRHPDFESGCVLAGTLCSCPESGEFFVVVLAAYEVQDADQRLHSLSYTGSSWTRILTNLRERQRRQPYLRILGQAHGHNFRPNEGKTCPPCLSRSHCDLTNLFASADDETWSRAVFSGQPWQLCHIFGLTARGDRIDGLFTWHDGRLAHRAFQILPEFVPDRHPLRTALCPDSDTDS